MMPTAKLAWVGPDPSSHARAANLAETDQALGDQPGDLDRQLGVDDDLPGQGLGATARETVQSLARRATSTRSDSKTMR